MDSIYKLEKEKGYCYASKEYLAKFIGITRQGLYKMLERLIAMGLLTADKRKLKTTETWQKQVEYDNVNIVDSSVNSVDKKCQKSLHNNNNINIYKNIEVVYIEEFKKKTGYEPDYKYARDRKILKSYIQKYGESQIIRFMKIYIRSGLGEWCGYSITGWPRTFNNILIEANRQEKKIKPYKTKVYEEPKEKLTSAQISSLIEGIGRSP